MGFKIFDFRDSKGINRIQQWAVKAKIPKRQLGKLNNRLDLLERAENDASAMLLLHGTKEPSILKIKIHGNPQLRPMLCRGPINMDDVEFTLLQGSVEKQSVNVPHESEATELRTLLQTNHDYRCPHVRFIIKTS